MVPVMHDGGWGWGDWLGMSLLMVVFWAAVVWAVVAVVRGRPRLPGDEPGTREAPPLLPPEEVLADRFARGEIGADEFRDRLAVLRGRPAVHSGDPAGEHHAAGV